MALSFDDIRTLFEQRGAMAYSGEPITQLEHALQTAQLAEQAGAPDTLIAAALLHDLGHLLHPRSADGSSPSVHGVDDLHQYYALPFLRPHFSPAVLEPIRLHVDAKRCLCAIDATYFDRLSPDSVRSLALQGGVFSADEASAFRRAGLCRRGVAIAPLGRSRQMRGPCHAGAWALSRSGAWRDARRVAGNDRRHAVAW